MVQERPGFGVNQMHLVLVDDRPGVEEDRAHMLAVGDDGEHRVVLTRDPNGEWILDRGASTLQAESTSVESGTVRIEHRDSSFRFARTFVVKSRPIETAFDIATDGKDVAREVAGRTSRARLEWQGRSLLLTVLIVLALSVPVTMALLYVPALVVLNDAEVLAAVRTSFVACLKNVVPFLVWGVAGLLMLLVSTPFILIGPLLVSFLLMVSLYVSYRDIFYDSRDA